jgi:class 3 adenylate cyclase
MVALVMLIATVLQNIGLMEAQAANWFTLWSIPFGINLAALWWWTSSKYYPTYRVIDLLITLPLIVWMDRLRAVVASQFQVTSWPDFATATGNGLVGLTFGSVFFAAYTSGFVIWAAAHALVFSFVITTSAGSDVAKAYAFSVYVPVLAGAVYSNWVIWRKGLTEAALREKLQAEKTKSEQLLFNLLPEEVAERLQRGEAIADAFSDVAVVFIDLVDSAQLAQLLSPKAFVAVLNDVFSIADRAAQEHGVEKVKTIGDAYLAVTGAHTGTDAKAAVVFACEVISRVTAYGEAKGLPIQVRAGVHSGPVVGGVIGETRATYDYWGNTMNVAARVQAAAAPGGLCVTEPTYYACRADQNFSPPRTVVLKGIGDTKVYDVLL